jgi:hypothetical protein
MTEQGSGTPFEARLFARGRMTSETVGYANNAWIQTFSGRVPSGWEDSAVITRDIEGAKGKKLSHDLVLAGLTHPDSGVRLVTAANQTLTVTELAVAMYFDEDGSLTPDFITSQLRRGLSGAHIVQATSLATSVEMSVNFAGW